MRPATNAAAGAGAGAGTRFASRVASLSVALLGAWASPAFAAPGTLAQFGTREPAVCTNRKAPPTAATVKAYVTCSLEGVFSGSMNLAADVNAQLSAPRPYIHVQDSGLEAVDVKQPLYDVRGSYTAYQCLDYAQMPSVIPKERNCYRYMHPAAKGRCWKDTFGDWHCNLQGSSGDAQERDTVAPPKGP